VVRRLGLAPGSSPRMRGTLQDLPRQFLHIRFIPAHAGNTAILVASSRRIAVHPRACGEHFLSSPTSVLTGRFIPAHAGNTKELERSRP